MRVLSLALITGLLLVARVHADDAATYTGVVTGENVYVRSGPGENFYATQKLNRGDTVQVVGIRFDWLKIVPPDGSFCYVAKANVDRRGDGSIGRTSKAVHVRAGSHLNDALVSALCKLEAGEDVAIIGEHNEYFKIKPPAEAFLYISKQFVQPKTQTPAPLPGTVANTGNSGATGQTPAATDTNVGTGTSTSTDPSAGSTPDTVADTTDNTRQNPATTDTNPSDTTTAATAGTAGTAGTTSTTRPSIAQEYDRLDQLFESTRTQRVEDQPLDELIAGYTTLAASPELAASLRRIAQIRLNALQDLASAREQLAAIKTFRAGHQEKQQSLEAERTEIQEMIDKTKVTIFTAVGTLRTSNLQPGGGTLYRLTDPATGRTVVYLRSSDDKLLAGQVGQFVGVRGQAVDAANLPLKIIETTDVSRVDPAQVGSAVAAQFTPASLLPKTTGQANIGQE